MGQVGRRRRRRWPFVLALLLLLVVAVVFGGDYAARTTTQDLIASDVQKSTHSASASATISSFPFLYDVTAQGRVDQVHVTDSGVPAGPFTVDQVRVDAFQVHFARSQLINQRTIRITEVGRATVTVVARLSKLETSLASTLGVQVTATSSDRVGLSLDGHTVASVDLTRIPLVPACPVVVTHNGGTFTFTCTVSPVPASVLTALSKTTSGSHV